VKVINAYFGHTLFNAVIPEIVKLTICKLGKQKEEKGI
jgi:hypothetical protein